MSARRLVALFCCFTLILLTLAASPSSALELQRMNLSNGATLLISEEHQLPMVTMAVAFDAGSRRDPKGKAGLASLTARGLTLGTHDLTAAQFNQKVDFMGSSVSVSASEDYAEAGFTSLKRYAGDTLALLASVLRHPALRDDDILRKRAEVVAAIKAAEQEPGYVASVSFRKLLFGNEPYGHPPQGTADSVAKLTPGDVRSFYKGFYRMSGAVIAVVGDVDVNQIKAQLEKELAGPTGTVTAQPVPPPPTVAPGVHVTLIDRNLAQANLILGSPGIARSNPDYYRFQVMNYILGSGGFASRLMKVVRSKAGLAYSIASELQADKFVGSFRIVLQTKNKSSNEALKLVMQQLHKMRNQPVTDEELGAAKKFLIGSFPLKLDRQSAIANYMLAIELYDLGLDYTDQYPKFISSVTKKDLEQVARKYLHPDAMIVVAVANQREAALKVRGLQEEAKRN